MSWGQFQATYELVQLRQHSESTVAWIGSLQAFIALLVGTLSGALYDLGYFRHIFITGSVLATAGFMATASATQLWHFLLAQSVCCGVGCGLIWVPSLSNIAAWFPPEKRGRAMGLASVGAGVGAIVYPILFRSLQQRTSFAWTVRCMGFVVLGTQFTAIMVARNAEVTGQRRRSLLEKDAFRDGPFLVTLLGFVLAFAALYVPIFYYPDFALRKHLGGENLAFYSLAIFSGASIPGRILPVLLSNRWTGPVNMMVLTTALCSGVSFIWIAVHDISGLILFAIAYGFLTGAIVTMGSLLPGPFSPTLDSVGARLGMCSGACALGALFGAPVAGVILKRYSYLELQVFVGCFLAGGAVFLALGRVWKTSGDFKRKI
jgi:predicted MFS family arabinose efflux permease